MVTMPVFVSAAAVMNVVVRAATRWLHRELAQPPALVAHGESLPRGERAVPRALGARRRGPLHGGRHRRTVSISLARVSLSHTVANDLVFFFFFFFSESFPAKSQSFKKK